MEPYRDYFDSRSKIPAKQHDPLQRKAMLIATSVQRSLTKYRFTQQFKRYNGRNSEMREEEFEALIRDSIFSVLQAEETYADSNVSKLFIDTLSAEIPKWFAPAKQFPK
ncbi:MAG: hypothetical protein IPK98_15450 [Chloracidobacterium sp.]|nr:hypothetical protein [Chloracidobacterium sp.]